MQQLPGRHSFIGALNVQGSHLFTPLLPFHPDKWLENKAFREIIEKFGTKNRITFCFEEQQAGRNFVMSGPHLNQFIYN